MFSYKTPNFIKKIDTRALSIFLTALYVVSLIPMLVLGIYDWPSADDFSMALQPHQYFVQTGSVIGTIGAAFAKTWWIYTNYVGYFFSSFLTCLCPSIFAETLYVVTPFMMLGILTFGVCYFFNALFVRVWKLDGHLSNSAAMITLILMVQCLHEKGLRFEAFYWYSGAINYTFTFGLAFFWLGLILRSIYDESAGSRKRKLIWAAFWGFLMGGSNYLTALEMAICSFLTLVIFFMVKRNIFTLEGVSEDQRKSFGFIWIPAVMNIIGFACSCLTPGNLSRSAKTEHYGPIKAVMLSLHSTLYMMINEMARWELFVALVLLIPIFWLMAARLRQKLQHPLMFALFAFLMVSSNMTPAFFAVASIEAGRIKVLAWMEFVFMMVMVVFYFTAWMRQHLLGMPDEADDTKGRSYSETSSLIIIMCLVFLAAGSVLCVIPDSRYYSCTSAITDLANGSAAGFRQESEERLLILRDDSIKDAALPEHKYQPEMLFSWDVTPDPDEWINTAAATYYNKDSVVLVNE